MFKIPNLVIHNHSISHVLLSLWMYNITDYTQMLYFYLSNNTGVNTKNTHTFSISNYNQIFFRLSLLNIGLSSISFNIIVLIKKEIHLYFDFNLL